MVQATLRMGHGAFEQAFAVRRQFAESANVPGRHLGVAVESLASGSEAQQLGLACPDDSFQNPGGIFWLVRAAHFLVVHRRDINVDVDAVEQGS